MAPGIPFVLLDDAREHGAGPARHYRDPVDIIVARTAAEVAPALALLRAATARGLHAAGFLAYDAGNALLPHLAQHDADDDAPPLLWFGLFAKPDMLSPAALPTHLPDPAGAWCGPPIPRTSRADYDRAIARVLALISAGDIYQANLTFPLDMRFTGDPLALYAGLRARARAGWGGVVFTGDHWLLSVSPELFFTATGGRLVASPMKGTAPPDAPAGTLRDDPKQRAENLMIVDLIRNDLARVAEPGTVDVPTLFAVETFPTVQQMTSTVTATLARHHDAIDVLGAAFPCGSITGAPKLRAMQVIDEIEPDRRGVYTGSIGWLDPAGDATFNVAIRTLVLKEGGNHATMGVGSGIVADSSASSEWAECFAKAAFLNAGPPPFDLIETMRFDPLEGLADLEYHLARLKKSAEQFGFAFDRHGVRNELQAATFRLRQTMRVRLMLSPGGALAIEVRALPAVQMVPVDVTVVPLPVSPRDLRLHHKTSDRAFYDDARRNAGTFEVLFEGADGFLTEGSFTSLFLPRGDMLLTPPLVRGLLPGVLRQRLIDDGRATEEDIVPADLRDGFLLGNAVRGLIPARLVASDVITAL